MGSKNSDMNRGVAEGLEELLTNSASVAKNVGGSLKDWASSAGARLKNGLSNIDKTQAAKAKTQTRDDILRGMGQTGENAGQAGREITQSFGGMVTAGRSNETAEIDAAISAALSALGLTFFLAGRAQNQLLGMTNRGLTYAGRAGALLGIGNLYNIAAQRQDKVVAYSKTHFIDNTKTIYEVRIDGAQSMHEKTQEILSKMSHDIYDLKLIRELGGFRGEDGSWKHRVVFDSRAFVSEASEKLSRAHTARGEDGALANFEHKAIYDQARENILKTFKEAKARILDEKGVGGKADGPVAEQYKTMKAELDALEEKVKASLGEFDLDTEVPEVGVNIFTYDKVLAGASEELETGIANVLSDTQNVRAVSYAEVSNYSVRVGKAFDDAKGELTALRDQYADNPEVVKLFDDKLAELEVVKASVMKELSYDGIKASEVEAGKTDGTLFSFIEGTDGEGGVAADTLFKKKGLGEESSGLHTINDAIHTEGASILEHLNFQRLQAKTENYLQELRKTFSKAELQKSAISMSMAEKDVCIKGIEKRMDATFKKMKLDQIEDGKNGFKPRFSSAALSDDLNKFAPYIRFEAHQTKEDGFYLRAYINHSNCKKVDGLENEMRSALEDAGISVFDRDLSSGISKRAYQEIKERIAWHSRMGRRTGKVKSPYNERFHFDAKTESMVYQIKTLEKSSGDILGYQLANGGVVPSEFFKPGQMDYDEFITALKKNGMAPYTETISVPINIHSDWHLRGSDANIGVSPEERLAFLNSWLGTFHSNESISYAVSPLGPNDDPLTINIVCAKQHGHVFREMQRQFENGAGALAVAEANRLAGNPNAAVNVKGFAEKTAGAAKEATSHAGEKVVEGLGGTGGLGDN